MNWAGADEILLRGHEYCVKLRSIDDWLTAIESIRAGIPKTFATEADALISSWNLEALMGQALHFSFKPLEGDSAVARTLGAEYSNENLSQALQIEVDEYYALVAAISDLRVAYEDALLIAIQHWKPCRAETVSNVMTIVHDRWEQSPPSAEQTLSAFGHVKQMMEHLAELEDLRVRSDISMPEAH